MNKFIQSTDKVCGNKYFPLIFIPIAFLLVLLFSRTTSMLYDMEYGDSAVFKMMGHVVLQGGIPYVDFFDHKGPILYLINALGEWISPAWGLFVLQIIVNSLAMMLWFYIAKLFVKPTYSFIATLLAIFFYIGVYEYGNLTEEWSILPSSLALYLGLAYLVKYHDQPHQYWRSLVYGLCFGTMFFIRPNDAVIQAGGVMTGIFLYLICKRKEYKNAILNALVFISGFAIIATPFIIYFASHHALYDFYYGLLGFNVKYSGGVLHNLFGVYRYTIGLMAVCAIPTILVYLTKQKSILWVLTPIYIFILLLFGRNGYPHYYMTLIPACFLIILTFMIVLFKQENKAFILLCFILLLMLPNKFGGWGVFQYADYAYTRIKSQCQDIIKGQGFFYTDLCSAETDKLFSLVPNNERDSIWNINDPFTSCFYRAGIIPQNTMPPVVAHQKANLTDQQLKDTDITLHKPLWAFLTNSEFGRSLLTPTDSAFVYDNYDIVYRTDTTFSDCYLLKRKD